MFLVSYKLIFQPRLPFLQLMCSFFFLYLTFFFGPVASRLLERMNWTFNQCNISLSEKYPPHHSESVFFVGFSSGQNFSGIALGCRPKVGHTNTCKSKKAHTNANIMKSPHWRPPRKKAKSKPQT